MNTIQSTLENNKLIAEFMGKDIGHENMIIFTKNWEVMKYHNDWNWLMQVVEKIKLDNNNAVLIDCYSENNFKYCTEIYSSTNFKLEQQRKRITKQVSNESLIITVYKAVIEFIKWYNSTTN